MICEYIGSRDELVQRMKAIECKLDTLIAALAEGESEQSGSLDDDAALESRESL